MATQTQAQATKTDAKKVLAAKVYKRIMGTKTGNRQKVIAELMEKVGLTKGGASTYFANFKNGNWQVDVKPVAKPVEKPAAAKAEKVAKPAAPKAAAKKATAPTAAKPTAAKKATAPKAAKPAAKKAAAPKAETTAAPTEAAQPTA